MPSQPPVHRVALLFNGSKIYDRGILAGIGNYLSGTRARWDLFLEEDFLCRLKGIERWQGDGIIADFDDPAVSAALADSRLPVVAVGGSYAEVRDYPPGIPYVATDNAALVRLAYDHLIESGLTRFACFSLPAADTNRWAGEREAAFAALLRRDGLPVEIYRGLETSAPLWDTAVEQLITWLEALPKPVGILAVTDARARQLLQACFTAGIPVPEQVALVGIDNDPLARTLTRVPLTSVIQGTEAIGREAARLLHQRLHGVDLGAPRVLIPPEGINIQASSRHQAVHHPQVMRALHFIRQYACQGIKTDQVASYVGISRSALETSFRRELGRSVHDEILGFKLAAAAVALQEGAASLAEVARRCGFTSAQYLHAVFRREFGCTPRQYQQQPRVLASAHEKARPETGFSVEPATYLPTV